MLRNKQTRPAKKREPKFDEKAHELKLQKDRAKKYAEFADDLANLISKHPRIASEVVHRWCDEHNKYLVDRTSYDAEHPLPVNLKKKSKRTVK
jgi:hypothetical protein